MTPMEELLDELNEDKWVKLRCCERVLSNHKVIYWSYLNWSKKH